MIGTVEMMGKSMETVIAGVADKKPTEPIAIAAVTEAEKEQDEEKSATPYVSTLDVVAANTASSSIEAESSKGTDHGD